MLFFSQIHRVENDYSTVILTRKTYKKKKKKKTLFNATLEGMV